MNINVSRTVLSGRAAAVLVFAIRLRDSFAVPICDSFVLCDVRLVCTV